MTQTPTRIELDLMQRAVVLARRGEGRVEPNPMVGCVVARNGEAVGEGWHQQFGGPHAEVEAIEAARGDVRGATLAVTLEPCNHTGKTPPCCDLLIERGIARVLVGCIDPHPSVNGSGIRRLRAAGIDVEVIPECGPAIDLIRPFQKLQRTGRPWVIAKWAMSLDGKIATTSGESRWITSSESRAAAHRVRGKVDAILVGSGTVRADDPLLTARPAGPRTALRVVCDSRCSLSSESALARTAREVPVLVACTSDHDQANRRRLEKCAVEFVVLNGESYTARMGELLDLLGSHSCTNLLAEGGSGVLGSLAELGEIDEVHAFVAPLVLGGSRAPSPVGGAGRPQLSAGLGFRLTQSQELGPDFLLTLRRPVNEHEW